MVGLAAIRSDGGSLSALRSSSATRSRRGSDDGSEGKPVHDRERKGREGHVRLAELDPPEVLLAEPYALGRLLLSQLALGPQFAKPAPEALPLALERLDEPPSTRPRTILRARVRAPSASR